MSATKRLFTVLAVANGLMSLWAMSVHRQAEQAQEQYRLAADRAEALIRSDAFDAAILEMNSKATWMSNALNIQTDVMQWTATCYGASLLVLVVWWISQGSKKTGREPKEVER